MGLGELRGVAQGELFDLAQRALEVADRVELRARLGQARRAALGQRGEQAREVRQRLVALLAQPRLQIAEACRRGSRARLLELLVPLEDLEQEGLRHRALLARAR